MHTTLLQSITGLFALNAVDFDVKLVFSFARRRFSESSLCPRFCMDILSHAIASLQSALPTASTDASSTTAAVDSKEKDSKRAAAAEAKPASESTALELAASLTREQAFATVLLARLRSAHSLLLAASVLQPLFSQQSSEALATSSGSGRRGNKSQPDSAIESELSLLEFLRCFCFASSTAATDGKQQAQSQHQLLLSPHVIALNSFASPAPAIANR